MSTATVVLYRYSASPFARKVDNILLLKGIPHNRVTVSIMPPRPELSTHLGINYRRIPVLAIGNDVYCDTSLIASALERRFPPSTNGYGTLFPPRKGGGKADTGMIKAFSQFYVDRMLFRLAASTLDSSKFSEEFIKDRRDYGLARVMKETALPRPQTISVISTHLALADEQLADGREWLFDTELPSLADISVHFIYDWIRPFGLDELFTAEKNQNPRVMQWMSRMDKYLADRKGVAPFTDTSGVDAAGLITSSSCEPYDVVGFNIVEANRLDMKENSWVAVAPDDTGKNSPTMGKLVGLSKEEFVVETRGLSGAVIRCHFPRLGFTIKTASDAKL